MRVRVRVRLFVWFVYVCVCARARVCVCVFHSRRFVCVCVCVCVCVAHNKYAIKTLLKSLLQPAARLPLLHLGLEVLDGVVELDLKSNGLNGQSLHQDLYTTTQMSHQVQSGLLLHLVFGNGKVLVEKRVCAKAKWVLYKGLCKSPAKYRCQLTLVHNRLGRHRTNEEHVVIGNTCLTLLSENVQLLIKAEPCEVQVHNRLARRRAEIGM